MRNARPETGLIAHRKALEAAGIAISLAMRVPAPLKSIADQVIRSASSVPANLSEGHGRCGRDRMHHWRIAYGSAKEVDTHLRLLSGSGAIDTPHRHRHPTLRRSQSHHMAVAQPEIVTGGRRGKYRPPGVPGLTLCPNDTSGPASPPAHCHTGHSSGSARGLLSGVEAGRRRASSVVAALPFPRTTTLNVRRWAVGTP